MYIKVITEDTISLYNFDETNLQHMLQIKYLNTLCGTLEAYVDLTSPDEMDDIAMSNYIDANTELTVDLNNPNSVNDFWKSLDAKI